MFTTFTLLVAVGGGCRLALSRVLRHRFSITLSLPPVLAGIILVLSGVPDWVRPVSLKRSLNFTTIALGAFRGKLGFLLQCRSYGEPNVLVVRSQTSWRKPTKSRPCWQEECSSFFATKKLRLLKSRRLPDSLAYRPMSKFAPQQTQTPRAQPVSTMTDASTKQKKLPSCLTPIASALLGVDV